MSDDLTPIPLADFSAEINEIWADLEQAYQRVLRSGRFILGPEVTAFEEEFAAFLGAKYSVGLASGTDALVIGLRSLGIGPGDDVLTTPFTFVATAEAIRLVGANPVFVDIRADTFNMDASLLPQRLTDRTRAVVVVHLYGHAAAMDDITSFATQHGLKVLEDVAQAGGGQHSGQALGTIGHAGAFSFFPSKNLGAFGDAGLLATDSESVAQSARRLRAHGSSRKHFAEELGYNSRLDALQAALLRVKLPRLEQANNARRDVAARYADYLCPIDGLQLPTEQAQCRHVYHQYTVRVAGGRRNHLRDCLARAGVGCGVYYPIPLHKLPPFADDKTSLPQAERAAAEVLSLPIWPQMQRTDQARVAQAVMDALRH